MNKRDVDISKTLSWILRHGAVKLNLNIDFEGYVAVSEILNQRQFKTQFNVEDIKRIVINNNKQRFTLKEVDDCLYIKANQGHSIKEVNSLSLTPLTHADFNVIHGTYFKAWNIIKNEGLSRMTRNHIHFSKYLPDNNSATSGIRHNSEVYIYINIKKALDDNIQFFTSENDVILSPGNINGYITPKYFLKVVTKTGQRLI